ncbi:MAG: aldolase/citrate lyase family protein [Planctomycetota bacterium]
MNEVPIAIWQHIPSPMISRFLCKMGWERVILDMQHGAANFETAYEFVHTVRTAGSIPWVRTSIGSPSEVQRALDIGARGVIVPMVNSVAEARDMARAAKYPPQGVRSFGGDASLHYGTDYPERANRETLLLVQIEHIDAVRQVEEILAIDGVDGCFVGPTDLALSMGLSRFDYEAQREHQDAIRRIVAASRSSGKLACCNTYSMQDFREKLALGFGCVSFLSEVDFFMNAGTRLFESLCAERKLRAPTGNEHE